MRLCCTQAVCPDQRKDILEAENLELRLVGKKMENCLCVQGSLYKIYELLFTCHAIPQCVCVHLVATFYAIDLSLCKNLLS